MTKKRLAGYAYAELADRHLRALLSPPVAAEILFEQMEHPSAIAVNKLLPMALIERGSGELLRT